MMVLYEENAKFSFSKFFKLKFLNTIIRKWDLKKTLNF